MQEGQHLSSPGPLHPSSLDVQLVSEQRGKGGPWVLRLPWKQPIFQSAAVLGVARRLPAEAYFAPGPHTLPCPGSDCQRAGVWLMPLSDSPP